MNRRTFFSSLIGMAAVTQINPHKSPHADAIPLYIFKNPIDPEKIVDVPNWGTTDGFTAMDKWLLYLEETKKK